MSTPARQLPAPERDRPGSSRAAAADAPLRVRPRRQDQTEQQRDAPALRVVPRHVRRRRAGLIAAVAVTAVFGLMLGLVAFQAKIAQDQLRIDRMEQDLRAAEDRFQQLRLQVAELQAPGRVVAEAEGLGLVRPDPDKIQYLAPPPEAVTDVLAAQGTPVPEGPTGDANASDWSALKPLLRGGP
jgi:cell division protein FtsL